MRFNNLDMQLPIFTHGIHEGKKRHFFAKNANKPPTNNSSVLRRVHEPHALTEHETSVITPRMSTY